MNPALKERLHLAVRALRWALFPLLLFVVVACDTGAAGGQGGTGQFLAAIERKSGLIAYVGPDGNIYTINQGGGRQRAITQDARLQAEDEQDAQQKLYLFPTWAKDSKTLAFAGISGDFGDPELATIYTSDPDGSELTEIYSSDSHRPLYLNWAPGDEQVTFLSSSQAPGLLLQSVLAGGGDNQILDAGVPFYWDWAPDGRRLLIHAGDNAEDARVSILTLMDEVVEEGVDIRPGMFQAPAWSPRGDQLLVFSEAGEGTRELLLTDGRGEVQRTLVAVEEESMAFAWSPDGTKVAYIADTTPGAQGMLGALAVIDLDHPDDEPFVAGEDLSIAFYWSPDGKKIAYFVPALLPAEPGAGSASGEEESTGGEVLVLGLFILDVNSGESRQIRFFQPTPEFFSTLSFFDQYQRSATIWSPDSKNVVVSAVSGEENKGIWVVNASGQLDPRPIAPGSLAFWSWK
jgi:Tol biopolymer transport system component